MADIFYGICGEGLGHSGRSMAIIDYLNQKHNVHIFTYGDAYHFFQSQGYRVHNISGLRFGKSKNGINLIKSAKNAFNYWLGRFNSIDFVANKAKEINPSLYISDFEPIIPLVARKLSKRVITIDQQHKLQYCSFPFLPLRLKIYQTIAANLCSFYIGNCNENIITTFSYDFTPSRKPVIAPILPKIQKNKEEDFVLVYYKSELGLKLPLILRELKTNIRLYGGEFEGIDCFPLNRKRFLEDLSKCKAVISAGGNQLIGEARYCGKPIFVIPIPNQHEQEISAYCVKEGRLGDFSYLKKVTPKKIEDFLNKKYEISCDNGLEKALKIIESFL